MMKRSVLHLVLLFLSPASAFVVRQVKTLTLKLGGSEGFDGINGLSSTSRSSSSTSSSATSFDTAVDFCHNLLAQLPSEVGGALLLENSSEKWRHAIYQAVGAPLTADEGMVSRKLMDAMSRSDNQFAILVGKAEPFVATFPSDPVDYQEGHSFVEVQLRAEGSDKLLVILGLQLAQGETDGQWLIAKLDWQDFRDDFYPGLSGREWLRAF
jgi:hypothetical protein